VETKDLFDAYVDGKEIVCRPIKHTTFDGAIHWESKPVIFHAKDDSDPEPWASFDGELFTSDEVTVKDAAPTRINKLGEVQRHCLQTMQSGTHAGPWTADNYNWYWDNASRTLAVMRSLGRRGLVVCTDIAAGTFELTEAGRAYDTSKPVE
jgi:hypothetical protein